MADHPEDIANCKSCGVPMDLAEVAPFSKVTCPACGKEQRVKERFGPYTLVRRHAVGGMSMVFAAHDPTLNREVALKILSEEFSADERRIAAFEEEARITASFSHPHVVRVLTTGRAFGRLYIAMEMVPGGHFESRIRKSGKVPEAEMLALAIEVAEGLKAAHAAGLIHRDIKPGNILLDADGRARIVDFGLALVTQGGTAQATEIWATPYYVPPETIEGAPEDFRSDIYAFGATLYHALAGKPPCDEESMSTDRLREAKQRVVPLGTAEPSISVATCRIVDQAMAYRPADRFSSYDEMIHALQSALKRLQSGTGVETSGHAARRRAQRKRGELLAFGAAAVVLAGALVGGMMWVTRKHPESPELGTAGRPVAVPAPAAGADSAVEIARNYRAARAAVEAGDFTKALTGFADLRENTAVQEPTRTWAAVEAVAAASLAGDAAAATAAAEAAALHVRATAGGEDRAGPALLEVLDRLPRLPAIPAAAISGPADAPALVARLLAGLKDWEMGALDEAAGHFRVLAEAALPADGEWLGLYQQIARHYLADHDLLRGEVFAELPADSVGCATAVARLEEMLGELKTDGRSRFNVRAWQLDILRHARNLTDPPPAATPAPAADDRPPLEIVQALAADYRFREAREFLATLPDGMEGANREALAEVTEAAAAFLEDLENDLAREPVTAELPLKAGGAAARIALTADGTLKIAAADGGVRTAQWGELAPDALIALHRQFMKSTADEAGRLLRHERAICFDWLAGNRARALNAAEVLSSSTPAFKIRWDQLSLHLPE